MTDICLHYKGSLAVEPPRGWSYLQGTCISSPSRGVCVCVLGERAKEESARGMHFGAGKSRLPHYAALSSYYNGSHYAMGHSINLKCGHAL